MIQVVATVRVVLFLHQAFIFLPCCPFSHCFVFSVCVCVTVTNRIDLYLNQAPCFSFLKIKLGQYYCKFSKHHSRGQFRFYFNGIIFN